MSGRAVLPPIRTHSKPAEDNDTLLHNLRALLNESLEDHPPGYPVSEQETRANLQVLSASFDECLGQFREYAPYLSEIKQQYDQQAMARSAELNDLYERHAEDLQQIARHQTRANFLRLRRELERRHSELEAEAVKLRSKLLWSNLRGTMHDKSMARLEAETRARQADHDNRKKKFVHNIEIEKAVDIDYMTTTLKDLQAYLAALKADSTSFVHESTKAVIEERISHYEERIENMESAISGSRVHLADLQASIRQYVNSQAARSAQPDRSQLGSRAQPRPPSSPPPRESVDVLLDSNQPILVGSFPSAGESIDSKLKLQQTYLKMFDEAFSLGEYARAAQIATACPDSLLRTKVIAQRFQDARSLRDSRANLSPLLTYCTVLAEAQPPPSDWESDLCFHEAVGESAFDLLTFWIANRKVRMYRRLGLFLESCCQCSRSPKWCACHFGQLATAVYQSLKGCQGDVVRLLVRRNFFPESYATGRQCFIAI
eukprot:m.109728 g.109728  ORF g.109728 m.109728 type:complete len:488 (+) comp51780_c0_seq2:41-1504(+)